jgi:ABC-type uncharacterized transport system substrate-binding protein
MERRMPRRLTLSAAALAATLAGPAAGHPHVFIDSGVDFLFNGEGRVSHLRITWIYDPLSSLFMLEDLGLEERPDGTLDDAGKAALARYQTQWIEGFEGDSYLSEGDEAIALSGPIQAEADYRDGAVVIRFLRALAAPHAPGPDTVAALYDPTYFSAYFITETPRLENAPVGCSAEVIPFEPTGPLLALQQNLLHIPVDADPEESVGHLFADRVVLACV